MITDKDLYRWGGWKIGQDRLQGWPTVNILHKIRILFGKDDRPAVWETELSSLNYLDNEILDKEINKLPKDDIRLLLLFYATRPKPTKKEIAKELGCHPSTIYKWLDRLKVILDKTTGD